MCKMPFESTELLEMLNSVNFDFERNIRILFKLSKILSQNGFFLNLSGASDRKLHAMLWNAIKI